MSHVHLLEELSLAFPLGAYREAFDRSRGVFLLDGSEASSHGSIAVLGAEPFLRFRAFRTGDGPTPRARVVIESDEMFELVVDDPLPALQKLLDDHAVDPSLFRDCALPLRAGAVGYIGYETAQLLERLPLSRSKSHLPDIAFSFHAWVLGACARTGRAWLSVLGRGASDEAARVDAERTRDRVLRAIATFVPSVMHHRFDDSTLRSMTADELLASANARTKVSRDDYLAQIREVKELIARGDVFEVCLTHRIEAGCNADPWTIFDDLRRHNPAPFAAILDWPEAAIVSSSPERFVKVDAQRIVESRPIKGTRPRGATEEEDRHLAADLARSEKDRAENTMIVDLVRNDLGRVCSHGTVTVPEFCKVESFASVHQLVSTVRGQLAPDATTVDLLRACFPPGSMTGAPKIEAMKILARLESEDRGIYAGGLGYIDFGGTLDMSVVIRTLVVERASASFSVGGAIVNDSDPVAEYDETIVKARALLQSLARVRNRTREGDR